MMATRTTITRTTPFGLVPSADTADAAPGPAGFLFEDLVQAYLDCRRNKRGSKSALAFEIKLESNLMQLHVELNSGDYRPGRSICFVVTHPKPREVWAADFRDRIVHHLLYNHIGPAIERSFIADSCACIKGRGTLYAARRLEAKVRSITHNWSQPAHYLKCDLANFFVSINKHILEQQLRKRVHEPQWLALALLILWHDPRLNYELRSPAHLLARVPTHKRLTEQPAHLGLPIGNLSSQFYANVHLDDLDQFAKHKLRAKQYVRYVDDFVLLHESPQQLNEWRWQIEDLLATRLEARLNPKKTIIQPVERGIDFVGQVVLPFRRITRRRTVSIALRRAASTPQQQLRETANSYFGQLGQASHSQNDRRKLAKVLLLKGRAVNSGISKISGGRP